MEWRELGTSGVRLPVIGLGAHHAFDVNGREAQLARTSLTRALLTERAPLFHTSDEFGEAGRVLGASLLPSRTMAIVATSIGAPEWREGQRQIDRMLHYFDGYLDMCAYKAPGSAPDYGPTMERLRNQGETQAVGIRLDDPSNFPTARRLLESRYPDYVEIPYFPDDDPERERTIALAGQLGIGVVAVNPFRGGRLARLHPPSASLAQFEDLGIQTWPQLVVKWILSNRNVTSVMIGTRRAARLRTAIDIAGPPWLDRRQRERVLRIVDGMRRG